MKRREGRKPGWSELFGRALCGVVAIAAAVSLASAESRTLTGCIEYGTINDDLGETSDPNNFVAAGSRIPFVTVDLEGTEDLTDANGCFSIVVNGTPTLTLKTRAENDFVAVKKDLLLVLPSEVLDTKTAVAFDYSTCAAGSTCSLGDITVVDDGSDFFDPLVGNRNYVSRAFYVASAAHASGTNMEAIHGSSFPGEKVVVRLGLGGANGTAFYELVTNTIHLGRADAVTFWHEYGHYIEDKIAAFGTIPSYVFDGGHSACQEILDPLDNEPNVCWSWFEGAAEWMGASNATDFYGSYTGQQNVLCRGAAPGCSPEYDPETMNCSTVGISNLQAVERITTAILWDLVDLNSVSTDVPVGGVEEIGEIPIEDVLAVITAPMGAHNPCDSVLEMYDHPVGLEEFFTTFRDMHPGVVPDLFSAYAFNGLSTGVFADVDAPAPAGLDVSSHQILAWSNNPTVTMQVTRGDDDVSGSYYYYLTSDLSPSTVPSTAGVATVASKAPSFDTGLALAEGRNQFIHLNSRDLAFHDQTEAVHFGPINIDLTDPYFGLTFLPVAGTTHVSGYFVKLSWESFDALSGVAKVDIGFDVPGAGQSVIALSQPAIGTFDWFPNGYTQPISGEIVYTVHDLAGNTAVHKIPITITPPFIGTNSEPDLFDLRVISADLDGNGADERIIAKQFLAAGEVQVASSTPALNRTIAWNPVDDLYAADYDRDGDLDVITVSRNKVMGQMVVEILANNGAGVLNSAGVSLNLGDMVDKKVRVAPLYEDGTPIITVFGQILGVPSMTAFRCVVGFPLQPIPTLTGVNGDWEAGDLEGDGDIDFVALGTDVAGLPGLYTFTNSRGTFTRARAKQYAAVQQPNVDLGDQNSDGLLDVFAMLDDGTATRITELLRRQGAGFVLSIGAIDPAERIALGDGYIVDLEADASAEVVAMGRTEAGGIGSWYARQNAEIGQVMELAPEQIDPLYNSDSTWGDVDGDGDLDIYFKGIDSVGHLEIGDYRNVIGDHRGANDSPPVPSNLTSSYDAVRGGYVFTWSTPILTNDETPSAGFAYELRVGTTNGGSQVLSWVHQAGAGLHGSGESRFVKLKKGKYYAQVRTVDSGWRRSLPTAVHQTKP